MQLAAFNNNQFTLGHTSMMINEGMPLYVVARLERRFDLADDVGGHPRAPRSRASRTTSVPRWRTS